MKTWVSIVNGIVKVVIIAQDQPAGDDPWVEYPYPSDIGGPANIAGRSIAEFDAVGNFIQSE